MTTFDEAVGAMDGALAEAFGQPGTLKGTPVGVIVDRGTVQIGDLVMTADRQVRLSLRCTEAAAARSGDPVQVGGTTYTLQKIEENDGQWMRWVVT